MSNLFNTILAMLPNTLENKAKELDLTKDEDYAKFMDSVEEIRKENDNLGSLSNMFFGKDFITNMLDELVEKAKEIHDAAKPKVEEAVDKAKDCVCNTMRRVLDKSQEEPVRPSENVNCATKKQIHNLVNEYIDEYIRPYYTQDEDKLGGISDGLFEFGCWVVNHK